MTIAGNIYDPNDNQRLDEWRNRYASVSIQEDPALPSNGFRTAGNVLYVASDFYQLCFGDASSH